MVGIVSYGAYIPKYRLKISGVTEVWGKEESQVINSLGISEKAVAGFDEDAVTLGYEAAYKALSEFKIDPRKIEALFVGSESHPYAVNPTSTIVGEFLGSDHFYFSSDLEFACKAATTGVMFASTLVESGKIDYGLVIGSDCAQAKPHDVLEYTAASAAAAFIIGKKSSEIIVEIKDFLSFSSDTPDFWRRDGISYPSHGGRFTGEPGYFSHIITAGKKLLEKTKMKPSDFASCVFHMPNSKFPVIAAKRLGFTPKQLERSLIVKKIGNPYSASSLLGLIAVLEKAKPEEYIFFVSYGSGAGADAFIFKTTKNLVSRRTKITKLKELISDKEYISYVDYLKMRKKI